MKLITEVLEDSVEYITEANEEGEKEYFNNVCWKRVCTRWILMGFS